VSQVAAPASLRASRAGRWFLGVGLGVMAALGLVLLFMLAQATGNRELYERYYPLLFVLNVAVAALLAGVILWAVLRMGIRLKQRKFGSRLLVKLAAIFTLVGLLPGLMIYIVSYQFVSRSIESWFDVRVESALASGLQLARVTLERVETETGNRARGAADQMTAVPETAAGLTLERRSSLFFADEAGAYAGRNHPDRGARRCLARHFRSGAACPREGAGPGQQSGA
jgi:nitrogen fixation/metabolism regulation signal transduction histidine kinase